MRKNTGEDASSGLPPMQSSRKVEHDINDLNRRNLEIDKYLAKQMEAPEVRRHSQERKIRLS